MNKHLPASAAFGFSHDFCVQQSQLFANARNVTNRLATRRRADTTFCSQERGVKFNSLKRSRK
jgi:hypothetical protein